MDNSPYQRRPKAPGSDKEIDLSPDRNPSGRKIFLCDNGIWLLEVAGLGVMAIRAGVLTEEADSMTPHIQVSSESMCSFTNEEIRSNEL
jgi:hypothetical protein